MCEGKAGFHKNQGITGFRQSKYKKDKVNAPAKLSNNICPQCSSKRLWKDGICYPRSNGKPIQRYICRECGYRFSETTQSIRSDDFRPSERDQNFHTLILKTLNGLSYNCQVGVSEAEGTKNLVKVKSRTAKRAAGATTTEPAKSQALTDIRGKIIAYLWYMKKKGLKQSTIEDYGRKLRQLLKLGVNLLEPEQVKKCLATNNSWSERTKAMLVAIYDGFATFLGIPWEQPKYKPVKKLPFIPTEQEIDLFISACGKKLATFMQLLKETGMRCGEASKLEWTDIDFQRRLVKITPEKGSDPRILPISEKLAGMLNNMPKQSNKVFPAQLGSIKANLFITRKSIARKLNNPRLLKISFHTLRHWKGTMEYHKTKDIIHVQKILGHRDIKSTMMYITLENALFQTTNDEFHVKTARTVEEACKLIEVGFEYVTTMDGVQIFRKRK